MSLFCSKYFLQIREQLFATSCSTVSFSLCKVFSHLLYIFQNTKSLFSLNSYFFYRIFFTLYSLQSLVLYFSKHQVTFFFKFVLLLPHIFYSVQSLVTRSIFFKTLVHFFFKFVNNSCHVFFTLYSFQHSNAV